MKILILDNLKYYISLSPEDVLIILNLPNALIFKIEYIPFLRCLIGYEENDLIGDKLKHILILTKQTAGIYKHFKNLKIISFKINNNNFYEL